MGNSPNATAARLLDAVADRDVEAVVACFEPDGTWQNVPHSPARGREAIRAMLDPILRRSSQVRWDVVTESYDEHTAWLERVDRFWIDGIEHAVKCNGVLEFDPETGLIRELRDYVDLGEWRARVAHISF
ncbi:MAG: nuclear transport factor 2 family protein [Actinomycetia bacterium]|nr:nuclear transport factor 2 family protein [Actinomycetes bacterium]